MKAVFIFAIILLQIASRPLPAQQWDLELPKGAQKIEIPFDYENNFIVISLVFNRVFPLKFIFDTGAEHTILAKREITDLFGLPYEKRFVIMGSDLKTELYAYLVRGVNLRTNNVEFTNRSILVLEDDYFQFDKFTGVEVAGIVGADLFRRFVVEINYQARKITLHDPAVFREPKGGFIEHPLEVKRNKPYFFAGAHFPNDTTINAKLLLDTGASLALLLYTDTHPDLHLPPQVIKTNIGMGLGGNLEGFLGRVERLDVAGIPFAGVITNFQELYPGLDTTFTNDRNGIIGNLILSRFVVIIDYIKGKLYLQPLPGIRKAFRYDRSGIVLAASGPSLNIFTVYQVVPKSPAEEAGILRGDILRNFNGLPAGFFTLSDLTTKLQGREGKKVTLKIEREGEGVMKVRFRLREII